ncbi:MAG: type III-A CRISPR-associated protein Cas10/Csm1 [Desulfurella sp.]|uniref:type III-A CRISPR-associated protein Cas10/Csm1 n=1 Tax=Desulfurella sp. TaxID=1962857 RepID=UPI003D14ADC6
MNLEPVELISLAALLHDIGKISQRAEIPIENKYNLEEYAPEKDGHYSYKHAAYTAEFLDWFVKEFKIESENEKTNLVNIASYHHKDIDEPFCKLIKYADHLASGFERTPQKEKSDYIKEQLISIFSSVSINNNQKNDYTFSLKPLSFDIEPQLKSENTPKDYEVLFNGLKADLQKLKGIENFDIFYDGLNYLLEKYAWCVPSSSFEVKADISLYDHLRVSAAFAAALYKYFEQSGKILQPDDTTSAFALIQGDFSGIQNFIFSKQGESNKFAAKILRARSFFVSLSTELVAYKIYKKLGLTKASVVMNAGGKFTILSHNAKDLKNIINEITDEVNNEFLKLNYGQTRFAIAHIELCGSDFLIDKNDKKSKFSQRYDELVKKLEEKKLKPVIKNFVFEDYLDSIKDGGICRICGNHPANLDTEDTPICEVCYRMKKIGENLVKNKFFAITTNETSSSIPIFSNYHLVFENKAENLKNALLAFEIGLEDEFRGFAKSKIAAYVPRLTQDEIDKYKDLDDVQGLKEYDIKPFSAIAKDAIKNDKGSDFLGVLKADVDNLGLIFARGFGENVSISKTVSLSRMLDFFFTGWLQNEIKTNFRSIYTVFSGGDDLFLIGPFNQIIELAKKINEHLRQYTKNEDFHLSCGIYFAKDKVPVYQMARQAEEILKKSKEIDGKNAITLFDRPMKWERFNEIMEIDLYNIFGKDKYISEGFKYSLFTYLEMIEKAQTSYFKTRDLLWKPLLIYNIYRNVSNLKSKEEKDFAIKNLLNLVDYFEKYKGDFLVPLSKYIYENRKGRS